MVAVAFCATIAARPARAAGQYDRSAAGNYAYLWSSNSMQPRNPAYINFDPADCTNFVSQVLRAGGYPDHSGLWFDCSNAFWYSNGQYSHPWDATDCQETYFANHPSEFSNIGCPGCLTTGDVLQMDTDGVGHSTHERIIMGYGADELTGDMAVLESQHDNDERDRYWSYNMDPRWPVWAWSVTW